MRYVVAPPFADKVLKLTAAAMHAVALFLKLVQTAKKEEVEALAVPLLIDDETIYFYRQDDVRIIFTFAADAEGDYLLILDLIIEKTGMPGAVGIRPGRMDRDPRSNTALNPNYNTAHNPKYNTTLNPKYNTVLNPKYNTVLNPKYNTVLNPKYNTTLNPKYNTVLNPKYNTTLNPKYNWAIDPTRNPALEVPRLYNLDLEVEGFVVRAGDKVQLVFGSDREFRSYTVKDSRDGFLVFGATDNEWIEYWRPDGGGGLLRFDTDGEWIGIVV